MAATRSDEGRRQCCLDHVRIWSSGPSTKSGGLVKNRHGGAPEGAPAGHTAGGCLLGGAQTKTLRLTGAPLPHFEGAKKRRRRPSANDTTGRRNSPIRLRCLTCESESLRHVRRAPPRG